MEGLDGTPLEIKLDASYGNSLEKTWLIRVAYKEKGKDYETGGTGFSLFNSRLVFTSAHVVNFDSPVVTGFHLMETGRGRRLEILSCETEWDVALLWDCSEEAPPPQSFKLADHKGLFVGQTLIHIGCGGGFGGTMYKFNIAYDLPTDDHVNRKDYNMTDMEDRCTISVKRYLREMKYAQGLPMIELHGTYSPGGNSGGPVFDLDGDLVGMLAAGDLRIKNSSTAVHGAVLAKAYKKYRKLIRNIAKRSVRIKNKQLGVQKKLLVLHPPNRKS